MFKYLYGGNMENFINLNNNNQNNDNNGNQQQNEINSQTGEQSGVYENYQPRITSLGSPHDDDSDDK